MNNSPSEDKDKPFHGIRTDGQFFFGFDTLEETERYVKMWNKNALENGSKERYLAIPKPNSITKPLPCPFCGSEPEIGPKDPEKDGNAWGFVMCVNEKCPARPMVKDGEEVCDDRGVAEYIEASVKRWNVRSERYLAILKPITPQEEP